MTIKKIRWHKNSLIFGFLLMLSFAVMFRESFFWLLAKLTMLKMKFFGGGETLGGYTVNIESTEGAKASDGWINRGVSTGNDFVDAHKKILSDYAMPSFITGYEKEFLTKVANISLYWRMYYTSLDAAVSGYIEWVYNKVSTASGKTAYEKMKAADRLSICSNIWLKSDLFKKLMVEVANSLRENKKCKDAFGLDSSPLWNYKKAADKGEFQDMAVWWKEYAKNSLLKINEFFMRKGVTLF